MANNQTSLQATDKDGQTVSVQHTQTDSPILPAANLKALAEIRPDLIDYVLDQTGTEADHRRKSQKRVETFVFIERISGVVAGAVIALFVFALGGYLILKDHDWAGVAICGTTLVSIVGLFVSRQWSARASAQAPEKPARRTQSKKALPSKIRH
jgi:hypothetical protein